MRNSDVHVSFLRLHRDYIINSFGIVSQQLQSRKGRTKNRSVHFKKR
jgi:hypothetical protein